MTKLGLAKFGALVTACGIVAPSVLALGCGSGAGGGTGTAGGTCGQVQPCGGDLVGTWDIVTGCANTASVEAAFQSELGMNCSDGGQMVTVTNVGLKLSGNATFSSDGTYTTVTSPSSTESITVSIPAACLDGVTCAEVEELFQQDVTSGTFQSATCTGSASCSCTLVESGSGALGSDTGTYTTSGNTLTVTSTTDAGSQSDDYCVVQGSTLHLIQVASAMSMGSMGQATIETDIVLQKQQ